MTDNPKDSMRREAKRHRDRIDLVDGDADAAADLFMETIAPKPGQIIALYWPKGREFDTLPLMERLLAAGIICALPVVMKDEWLLRFVAWGDGDALVDGPYGLKQPPIDANTAFIDPDIFIVPLLAFDQRGNRLGYGGGYYDETLRHYRDMKDVIAVGYGYAEQAVLFNLPVEDHDQKLDYMITPRTVRRFTA
ncbi:5-formyltetrahydrofolate cyclo-ligase [Micavibrio aeruginosavorus]|uniref:5-formyltetrahydrofolate cyclo-ligase n=1 Tax=Micavibrio aeruginosavorus TaxID=349221 RepID=UPI003F4A8631